MEKSPRDNSRTTTAENSLLKDDIKYCIKINTANQILRPSPSCRPLLIVLLLFLPIAELLGLGPYFYSVSFFVASECFLSYSSGISSIWLSSLPISAIISALYFYGSCICECQITSWHFVGTEICPVLF